MRDCTILLAVRDALAGTATLDWSADRAISRWDGVTVAEGRVTRIDLPARDLTGRIPPALGNLSNLRALNLADNSLTGEIPKALLSLPYLRGVNLAGNSLTGRLRPASEYGVPHAERRRYSYIPLRAEATTAMTESALAGASVAFQSAPSATIHDAFAEEFANAVTFVADRYGLAASPGATMLVLEDIRLTSYRLDTRVIALTAGFLKSIAHEYIHDTQNDLSDGRRGPRWLSEGMAVYFENLYYDATGYATLEEQRSFWQGHARRVRDSLDSTGDFFTAQEIGKYSLGFVAIEYLVSRTSEDALWNFYRLLGSRTSWQAAFSEAFDMAVSEFYQVFEPHRAQVAPPLPTISGVVTGPDGEPAVSFTVFSFNYPDARLQDSTWSGRTASDGTFTFASETGQRTLSIARSSCGQMGFVNREGSLSHRETEAAPFEVGAEDVTDVVITLPVDPELPCEPRAGGWWRWWER